jgi:hypothetical protein
MVMMWASSRSSLMMLIIEASVVVLPEPVGPVTSTRPRGLCKQRPDGVAASRSAPGQQLGGNLPQHQAEVALFLENADAETGRFAEGKTEVRPPAFAHVLDVVFGGDAAHQFLGVLRRKEGPSTRCRMPCTRMTGGTPTRMCKSEEPSDTTNCNKSDME